MVRSLEGNPFPIFKAEDGWGLDSKGEWEVTIKGMENGRVDLQKLPQKCHISEFLNLTKNRENYIRGIKNYDDKTCWNFGLVKIIGEYSLSNFGTLWKNIDWPYPHWLQKTSFHPFS